jgi:hypothetical protein
LGLVPKESPCIRSLVVSSSAGPSGCKTRNFSHLFKSKYPFEISVENLGNFHL